MASPNDSSSDSSSSTQSVKIAERTHFKIGSRKSKLAMVQSEYVMGRLKELHANYTFEIVNFDTKGDRILNIALPKIGDKGLFTKELEDALENNSIDFVVHSLKDMPCQTLPDSLIIAGVPEREDPSDALVIANRWRETKKTLDDLDEKSTIGTSSLRRISQLKLKYPTFNFETIRGNLQTRFAKLDDENDKKFDAIILATAGLKRLEYKDRISQILDPSICMHAVSQGALGIECRRHDLTAIRMLNELNHEDTVLRCIAERTFLAKLEGGCSAPIGVTSKVTRESILLEGAVFDLEGTMQIKDTFEIRFDSDMPCPILNQTIHKPNDTHHLVAQLDGNNQKRKLSDSEEEDGDDHDHSKGQKVKTESKRLKANVEKSDEERTHKENEKVVAAEKKPLPLAATHEAKNHYSFIMDLNLDVKKLIKSELCGLHLAEKLKEMGADVLINEIKEKVLKSQ